MQRKANRCTEGRALFLSFVLVICAPGALAGETVVNLSGDWRLDPTVSDDLQTAMREARPERRGQGGPSGQGRGVGRGGGGRGGVAGGPGGGAGGGRGRGGGRGQGGGPSEEQREAMRARREALTAAEDALQQLQIQQAEGRLTITDATGAEQELPTDGSRFERLLPDGREGASTARFHDRGHLVVESKPIEGRGRLIETYALGAEGGMLVVTTEIPAAVRRGKIELRRIYRRTLPEE